MPDEAIYIISAISILLASAYQLIMNKVISGLASLSYYPLPLPANNNTAVSIVIPFRNESANIDHLINDLAKLYYPAELMEIIFVDDHSDTKEFEYVRKRINDSSLLNYRIFKSGNEGKKQALLKGISEATNEIVIQTDADCHLPAMWVNAMLLGLESGKEAKAVMGAVKMQAGKSFWSRFAALEFMSLQASGTGLALKNKAIMANGANLSYYKNTWLEHYHKGGELSSGDDVFFIQSLSQQEKKSVAFNLFEGSMVSTEAPLGFKAFVEQRRRWGSKSATYISNYSKWVAAVVALNGLMMCGLLFLGFIDCRVHQLLAILFIAKFFIDAWVLKSFARETHQNKLLWLYPLATIVYPVYISYVVLLIIFPFSTNKWKGRAVKT